MDDTLQRLSSDDPEERIVAVIELGRSGDPGAINYLESLIQQDDDERVRRYARSALQQLTNSLKRSERIARQEELYNGHSYSIPVMYPGRDGKASDPMPIRGITWGDAALDIGLYAAVHAAGILAMVWLAFSGFVYIVSRFDPGTGAQVMLAGISTAWIVSALKLAGITAVTMFAHMALTHGVALWYGGVSKLPHMIHRIVPFHTRAQMLFSVVWLVAMLVFGALLGSGSTSLVDGLAQIMGGITLFYGLGVAMITGLLVARVYSISKVKGVLSYIISSVMMVAGLYGLLLAWSALAGF